MAEAKPGDTVKVHYTGRLEDGTVFDSSNGRDPLTFTIGEGQVIAGFEEAVVGMSPGETRTETIPSDHAYGPHRPDLVLEVPRDRVPDDLDPELGQQLAVRTATGRTLEVVITEVSDAGITLDANHPLAGKDLVFDLELVTIE